MRLQEYCFLLKYIDINGKKRERIVCRDASNERSAERMIYDEPPYDVQRITGLDRLQEKK